METAIRTAATTRQGGASVRTASNRATAGAAREAGAMDGLQLLQLSGAITSIFVTGPGQPVQQLTSRARAGHHHHRGPGPGDPLQLLTAAIRRPPPRRFYLDRCALASVVAGPWRSCQSPGRCNAGQQGQPLAQRETGLGMPEAGGGPDLEGVAFLGPWRQSQGRLIPPLTAQTPRRDCLAWASAAR